MTYILITCLVVAISIIIILLKLLKIQLAKVRIYEQWILDFRNDVLKTFLTMKSFDDRQIFEKDDEVGSVFQQMLGLIEKLNQRTSLEKEKE